MNYENKITNLRLQSTANFYSGADDICWYRVPKITVLNRRKFRKNFRTNSSGTSTVCVESNMLWSVVYSITCCEE